MESSEVCETLIESFVWVFCGIKRNRYGVVGFVLFETLTLASLFSLSMIVGSLKSRTSTLIRLRISSPGFEDC